MALIETDKIGRIYEKRSFLGKARRLAAVDGVSLSIEAGRMLAVVGESGSGKSTLGRLMIAHERPSSGMLRFEGRDPHLLSTDARHRLKRDMQMVFQNALSALDPRMAVLHQIAEPLIIHSLADGADALQQAGQMMKAVGLDASLAGRRPSEVSGGQQQRVIIARALVTGPRFVVFDEAVSALDVSVQAQIIALIRTLQAEEGFAGVFISHDLRVVRHVADEVAVMYLGQIVERGPVKAVFERPAHPYTRALISAIPGGRRAGRTAIRLEGDPPDPAARPSGCAFHTRCPSAIRACARSAPHSVRVGPAHIADCHLLGPGGAAPMPAECVPAEDISCAS